MRPSQLATAQLCSQQLATVQLQVGDTLLTTKMSPPMASSGGAAFVMPRAFRAFDPRGAVTSSSSLRRRTGVGCSLSMQANQEGNAVSRRTAVLSALVASMALFSAADRSFADGGGDARAFMLQQTSDPANPYMVSARQEKALLDDLAKKDVVFLGEHHNKAADHNLQAMIISGLSKRRGKGNVAVGLEMVQQQFQPVLDSYVAGTIADDAAAEKALYDGVEWAERWQWSFEDYLPVFRLARTEKIPLVALNVDSAVMEKVRFGGLESMSQADRDLYVQDKKGFVAFARTPGFVDYVERVIMPSFGLHARMGLLGKNPSQANFYSSRILWDESMSTRAYRFLESGGTKTMVVLEGADHIKFSMGSVGRMKRMAPGLQVASVMLNPTPVDTLGMAAEDEAPLSLYFPYGGRQVTGKDGAKTTQPTGVLRLADYLWFSAPPSPSLVPPSLRIMG